MIKTIRILTVVLAASAIAVSVSTAQAKIAKKDLSKVTCEEFNGLDDSFKPKVIAWAVGFGQGKKKPEAVEIDVDGVEKITPFVIEACAKAPKESFWSKVDDEMKKVF